MSTKEYTELLELRRMVSEQKLKIQQQEVDLLKRQIKIEQQESELEKYLTKIQQQELDIQKHLIKIENLTQALLHAKKKIFGSSSEATKPIEGQASFFSSEELLVVSGQVK